MFRRIFSYPSLALGASESIGSPLTDYYLTVRDYAPCRDARRVSQPAATRWVGRPTAHNGAYSRTLI